jgi:hypothetical protein
MVKKHDQEICSMPSVSKPPCIKTPLYQNPLYQNPPVSKPPCIKTPLYQKVLQEANQSFFVRYQKTQEDSNLSSKEACHTSDLRNEEFCRLLAELDLIDSEDEMRERTKTALERIDEL